jgi:hypothetical protein
MVVRRLDVSERRSRHPEGTLGIELRSHTLTLYPILTLPLAEAQFLSGSTSRSATRQARKLVLKANYRGAVRVVTDPGGGVSLAYEANDGRVYCMEATVGNAVIQLSFEESAAASILQGTLESVLLDEPWLIKPDIDVVKAFTLAVVAVNGALAVGKPLAFHEVEIAANRRKLMVRPWGCDKPAAVRAVRS